VKSNQAEVARIAERLTWIIRRREEWEFICGSSTDTFRRLREALINTNLVVEAVSKD